MTGEQTRRCKFLINSNERDVDEEVTRHYVVCGCSCYGDCPKARLKFFIGARCWSVKK